MRRARLLILALTPVPALACKCLVTYPVCPEVAASEVVFIGTVESVGPSFLDPWHWRDPASAIPLDEIERLRRDGSPAAARQLKAIYGKMLGNLTGADERKLESATTLPEVEAGFKAIVSGGRRAHFKVKTMLRAVKDDDGDKADDKDKDDDKDKHKDKDKDDATPTDLDVWTEQDDCGIEFQKGETYLVYAGSDEDTGQLETSVCYRTKRLSDAGTDLAYLHFFQFGGDASSRIEGFVTHEWNQDLTADPNRVESPAPNLVVGLKWPAGLLYTRSDRDGRFIFDGLAGGAYDLTVFDPAFPRTVRVLAEARRITVPAKGCGSAIVVVPPAPNIPH